MRTQLLCLSLALLAGSSLSAQIIINEFSYDDSGTDDREFVELLNTSSSKVDLSGWKILGVDANGTSATYTISNGKSVAGRAFFVVGSGTVPNVNEVIGAQNLFENDADAIVLQDKNGRTIDSIVYETNKGVWTSGKRLLQGEGVWGNFTSIDRFEMSWGRIRDGANFRNNRIFHLLRSTPGKSNNQKSVLPYRQNFDTFKLGVDLPGWQGSFRNPKIIDPTLAGSDNTHVIKASPQGGKACIFWDNAGGGNAHVLVNDWIRSVTVEAWVYFDAKAELAGFSETWSLGVQGSCGTYFNQPNPAGLLNGHANGNTGVSATYQVTDKGGVLYLIDHNDGGEGSNAVTKERVLGQIKLTAGKNDGWQRLRLTVVGNQAELLFGGKYGCGDGTRLAGRITQPAFGGIYVGYREFIQDNKTARPFTCDDLRISIPGQSTSTYGTAKATSKGTPKIGTNGLPTLGFAGFAITGTGLVPNSASLYLLGAQQSNIDLGAVGGQQGSRLLTIPLIIGARVNSAKGESSLPLPLPCVAGLKGAKLYWQILDIDRNLKVALPVGNSEGLITTLDS